jgi:hypothetical protein
MKSEKKKTCFDCYHCKVSAKSSGDEYLCFCAVAKKKEIHQEPYWSKKAVCKKFKDMTA